LDTARARRRSHGRFGRGGRRCRPDVSHEVADGDVHFVSHARYHRYGRCGHCARDALVVEGPEILAGATATGQDQDVGARPAGSAVQRTADVLHGPVSLHGGRHNNDLHHRGPAADDRDNVAQRCAIRARDNGNRVRIARQTALALGIEQTFLLELQARAFQGFPPKAVAFGLHATHHELHLALGGVHAEVAERRYLHPLVRGRGNAAGVL
jgi:hypothetical protein